MSSDHLRAVVGAGERDQRASRDAFELLDLIVAKRLRRGLTTVVDTTGLEPKRRAAWRALARGGRAGLRGRARHAGEGRPRAQPRPRDAGAGQGRGRPAARGRVEWPRRSRARGSRACTAPARSSWCRPRSWTRPQAAARQGADPLALEFGLQVSRFGWGGATAQTLAEVARAAEEAGFTSLWLMDHFLQIPQVGREWEDMLESYTTLGYLAGVTERIRLGTLVTGVAYRNLAHLAKLVATLDVLSGGRALCGLGAGWFEREHRLYGWAFPPLAERYALLEDALELLPLMWGPGSPRFEGRTTVVAEATCYPRPLQERIPLLVGGSGERRTLRLVARHADACNLFGDPDDRAAQARGAAGALRGGGARSRRRSGSPTSRPPGSSRRASPARARARRASMSTSAATAASPRPACRPRSSRSPTRAARSPSRASRT